VEGFTGFSKWGPSQGDLRDGSPPVGSRDVAPIESLGDEIHQKLKQNVKSLCIFNIFLYKI